jgi:hypothetical protein
MLAYIFEYNNDIYLSVNLLDGFALNLNTDLLSYKYIDLSKIENKIVLNITNIKYIDEYHCIFLDPDIILKFKKYTSTMIELPINCEVFLNYYYNKIKIKKLDKILNL